MLGYSIFVSHSGVDFALVQSIQDAARPLGIKIYAFEQDLRPGADLPKKLRERIVASDAVLVVLTHAGAQSPAVNQEIGIATQAGKPIIPLLDSDVDPAPLTFLQGKEYILLNRENPTETLLRLTGRFAQLKSGSEKGAVIVLLIIGAIALWAASSNG